MGERLYNASLTQSEAAITSSVMPRLAQVYSINMQEYRLLGPLLLSPNISLLQSPIYAEVRMKIVINKSSTILWLLFVELTWVIIWILGNERNARSDCETDQANSVL